MILLALFLTLLALFTSKSTQTNNYSGRPCFQELPLLQMSTQERNREARLGSRMLFFFLRSFPYLQLSISQRHTDLKIVYV